MSFKSSRTIRREKPQERAHQLDTLLSVTADFNYVFDRQGCFSYINKALLDLLGITSDQAIGRNFHDLHYPTDLATKLQAQIEQVFVTGKPLKDETPFTNPEGKWGYYEYIFVPVIDSSSGEVQAVAGSTRDISKHKRVQMDLKASEERLAELNRDLERKVQERTDQLRVKDGQLMQAQKLEAIGRLSGGVAHDFNNLITGILGISEELCEEVGSQSPYLADLREIIKAANKASSLTRQLLAFARRQVMEPKIVNLNAAIVEMNRMIGQLLGANIEVSMTLDPRLGNIKMDPTQLEQIIVNLMLNARDAISGPGQIQIRSENTDIDHAPAAGYFSIPPGRYVCLTIADNGSGMNAETLEHVFEPFFTTKKPGQGTGLGLATVYGIIKQNNGDISVFSEIGKGTTFRIYFPRVTETVAIERRAVPRDPSPGGHEKILVVEDEDIVRRVAVKALKKAGYTVWEAKDGKEALSIVEELTEPINLLITDIVMPGINGQGVAKQVAEKCPGIRVLFMSGHSQEALFKDGFMESSLAFIEKTFTANIFCRKVRDVLDHLPPYRG